MDRIALRYYFEFKAYPYFIHFFAHLHFLDVLSILTIIMTTFKQHSADVECLVLADVECRPMSQCKYLIKTPMRTSLDMST